MRISGWSSDVCSSDLVNPWFTERFSGMTAAESRPLLDFLAAEATRPENVYRHRWRQHDVIMWDNRAAMHYAVRDYDENQIRILHRTTALGDQIGRAHV